MDLWQLILLALIGCLTGFINVMAGGGSLLTMPVMVFMGMPGPLANGTNRVAILAQNITAVAGFFRQGFSDFKLSLSLSLCALPGALIGAYFGTKLQGLWFNRVLAGVMITVMVLMSVKKHRPGSVTTTGPPGQKRFHGHLAADRLACADQGHIMTSGAGQARGLLVQDGANSICVEDVHGLLEGTARQRAGGLGRDADGAKNRSTWCHE